MKNRRSFTPNEKAKIVIEVLREEKTLNEIALEHEIHPNQLSRWKAEFINNAGRAFSKETDEIEKVNETWLKAGAKSRKSLYFKALSHSYLSTLDINTTVSTVIQF